MTNYTEEQKEYIIAEYTQNPTRDTVDILADKLGKSSKSIIGKLSREGVYKRSVYKTKTGETPITKKEIVCLIAEELDLTSEELEGLDKTPKLVLKSLYRAVKSREI